MIMNEQKILNGARKMIQEHMLKIGQAGAGTNLKRRVNVTRNYLKNLKKLQNYLYGGRSNVRNIQGFGRNTLANNINIAEQLYEEKVREYIHDKRANAIKTARNILNQQAANSPAFSKNWTLVEKKRHYELRARGFRRVKQYLQNQIRNEPMLSQDVSIKRHVEKANLAIKKLNKIVQHVNSVFHELQSRRKKYPGSGPY